MSGLTRSGGYRSHALPRRAAVSLIDPAGGSRHAAVNVFVPIALYGWFVVVLALFSCLPVRRAVLISFVGAWLFLPQAGIPITGLPDVTKISVTSFGVMAGIIVFTPGLLRQYRLSWVDLPVIVWCLSPLGSSISNKLGVYDGFAGVLDKILIWGVPYLVGRLAFNDLASLRELAIAIIIGGLIYIPFCLWEIRMSPQLHRLVYGEHQHAFVQTIRGTGYRPMVFMQHGLMVGMWMISATLVATWLWLSRSIRSVWQAPPSLIAGVLLVTSVLCKSVGSLVLLSIGLGTLFAVRFVRTPIVMILLVAGPPVYITLRAQDVWHADALVTLATHINEERALSLAGRLQNEIDLMERAFQKPVFGWGSWGDWRIVDERGEDRTTADSLWIITLGQGGLVGLVSLLTTLLLPPLLLLRRVSVRQWLHPAGGGAAVLAVLLVLFTTDGLLNAMLNPIFIIAAGGLSGFYVIAPRLRGEAMQRAMRLARWRAAMLRRAATQPH
jgi:hypothetical protein